MKRYTGLPLAALFLGVLVAAPARAVDAPLLTGGGTASTHELMQTFSGGVRLAGKPVVESIGTEGPARVPAGSTGCVIERPRTAAAGLLALRRSVEIGDGCIDFARASYIDPEPGGPKPLRYLPYATDALTFAVSADSVVPRSLTKRELVDIYTCRTSGIRPLLPEAGSHVRARWQQYVGITDADLRAGKFPCVTDRANNHGVLENDGRMLLGQSIVPYSAGRYAAQLGGSVADVRADAVLGTIAGAGAPVGGAPVLKSRYANNLSFVVRASSNVPRRMSTAELRSIYTCGQPSIAPLLPAAGSTRLAWLNLLGLRDADVRAGVYRCIRTAAAGASIATNDGRVLSNDAVVPYDTSEYLRQLAGSAPDLRSGVALGVVSDASGSARLPVGVNADAGSELIHPVYNVVPSAAAASSPTNEIFVGTGSLLCQSTALIESFGFSALGSTCGSTAAETAPGPALPPALAARKPTLIKHGWDMPSPAFVRDHVRDMEQLPFDGLTISIPGLGTRVQRQEPISYEQFRTALAPHAQTQFTTLTTNFATAYASPAGSFFDDYSVPIQNFQNLARAAREAGFAGILYDNEEYFGSVSNFPGVCPGHSLVECQQQARLRGRQMMDAMRAVWPDIKVLSFFGPWISEPKTLDALSPIAAYNDVSQSVELMGSFFVGLAESAVGTPAEVIDGGEIYTARTKAQFEAVNAWQNTGMPAASDLIPASLKPVWAQTVSAGFGVFDRPWIGVPMDVGLWESTLANALATTDEYVWAYTEQHDWWGSGWPGVGVPDEWVAATRKAKAAAG